MQKVRLDVLLTDQGLAESRSQAQRLVMAGQVRVDGQVVIKPSIKVPAEAQVTVEKGPPFVSRGGEKLAGALPGFGLEDLSGRVCVDVGSSTGGFTDCMLQHGAQRVYAVDVGYGILHWKLRTDERVVVMERTNARYVNSFPEPINLVTIDASFISLRVLLPVVKQWFAPRGEVVALIKPQFEAGRAEVAKGEGVVRDPEIHRKVLAEVLAFVQQEGFGVLGLQRSTLVGPKGNAEFLVHLAYPGGDQPDVEALIEAVLQLDEAPGEDLPV